MNEQIDTTPEAEAEQLPAEVDHAPASSQVLVRAYAVSISYGV